jgi:hypothetical protein
LSLVAANRNWLLTFTLLLHIGLATSSTQAEAEYATELAAADAARAATAKAALVIAQAQAQAQAQAYGARFKTRFCTRERNWFPRLLCDAISMVTELMVWVLHSRT